MNIDKINPIYTAVVDKEDGESTLTAQEWINISEAVQESHSKINDIIQYGADSSLAKAVSQINQIKLSCTKTVVLTKQNNNVQFTATSEADADKIEIKDNSGVVVASGQNGVQSVTSDNINIHKDLPEDITYTATVTIGGEKKYASCNISTVHAVKYGVGDTGTNWNGLLASCSTRTSASNLKSPNGDYTFVLNGGNNKCFICIPNSVTDLVTTKVYLSNGYGFNMERVVAQHEYDGIKYNIYRSKGTYNNQTITVSVKQ